jgi:hypothetical protein
MPMFGTTVQGIVRIAAMAMFGFAAAPAMKARAQDLATAPIGAKVSKTATLYGHLVPLPPGEFELLSRQIDVMQAKSVNGAPAHSGGGNGHMAAVWLMSLAAGKLDTIVYMRTNESSGRWNMSGNCSRTDVYFKFVDGKNSADFECWLASTHNFDISTTPSPAHQEYRNRTAAVGRPNMEPYLFFSIAHRRESMDVQYSFNPRRWQLADDESPYNTNAWRVSALKKVPAKARVLQLLTDQGQPLSDAIKLGLEGRESDVSWKLD